MIALKLSVIIEILLYKLLKYFTITKITSLPILLFSNIDQVDNYKGFHNWAFIFYWFNKDTLYISAMHFNK